MKETIYPYFQFQAGIYLAGNIQNCSLASQGLFINLCSLYWQRGLNISLKSIKKRYRNSPIDDLITDLLEEGVIELKEDENINIKFLDEHHKTVLDLSKKRSQNGRKGGQKKASNKQNSSKTLASTKQAESKTLPSREEEIRIDKIRVEERREDARDAVKNPPPLFENFLSFCINENPNVDRRKVKERFEYYERQKWIDQKGNWIPDYWQQKILVAMGKFPKQENATVNWR